MLAKRKEASKADLHGTASVSKCLHFCFPSHMVLMFIEEFVACR